MSPLRRYREHLMRTRPVLKRHDYRSLRVFQFSRGLKCIIRRRTPRHYKNDELANENEPSVTNEFANEFAKRYFSSSTVADAKKPDLRAEKMTRAGKIQTYRNVRHVRVSSDNFVMVLLNKNLRCELVLLFISSATTSLQSSS